MIGHQTLGEGARKVMVLHGWLGDSSAFDAICPFLDLETFTYVFMDYRGYGQSRQLSGEHTMAEIGQDALALAGALGWERFSLIGHSMGGMAVQWLAAHAPERIESVVAIAPVPASGFPMDADTLALFRGAKDIPQNRETILMITTGHQLTPAFGKVMAQRSLVQASPDAFDDYLTAWSQTQFVEQVAGLTTPLLILVGQQDPVITSELMQDTLLKWFPNATLETMAKAGHYPMIETPLALVTHCEAFLRLERPVRVKA
jgi:pimeloyl-ACP methyl ester carboxylesterase